MLLQDKVVVVFAATGAVGAAVASRCAAEGARVFISARDRARLATLAEQIGAQADTVDACDEAGVCDYVDRIAGRTGGIDLVFNAIGPRPAQAAYASPATALPLPAFMLPLQTVVASQFLTARAAARYMLARRRGAIVLLSASLSGQFIPLMAGITAACGAVEGLTRTLAAEFGPAGVRVNCVRAGAMPQTRTIRETTEAMARAMQSPADAAAAQTANVLRRGLQPDETAATVAFVGSDHASGIAGQVINVCAGAMIS